MKHSTVGSGRFRRIQGLLLVLLIVLIVTVLLAMGMLQFRINALPGSESDLGHAYRYHFAMVIKDDDPPFWQMVYRGAQSRAAQMDSFVELICASLTEDYSVCDQLQMAAYAGMDGIFVVPDGETETNAVIGEIVKKPNRAIPVMTLMENDSNSGRSGYVGINNYEQGLAYSARLIQLAQHKDSLHVILLASDRRDDDQKGGYSGDVIYSSIIESLMADHADNSIHVTVRTVNCQNVFSCETDIKHIIQREGVPDVLICPDYLFTMSAAQVLVEQNLVGRVSLLGASLSPDILEYIRKGTIEAVVTIDPYLLGSVSVDGMLELMQSGRTNDYTVLETIVIDGSNVEQYAQADTENRP